MAFGLVLLLALACCWPAQADMAALDSTLSRWLIGRDALRFSATLTVNTLLPFTDDTLTLLNGVLSHVTIDANVKDTGESSQTDAQIAVDGTSLMDWSEQAADGAYTLTTSLLPDRMLTATNGSPMDVLSSFTGNEAAEEPEANAEEEDAETVNDSDVAQAFSLLNAIEELQACYQELTDGIQEYATEKSANYSIKNIGRGKWSRVARLTAEQSESLLPELRAVLSCGMDDTYRAEIAEMTFAKGFVVALYRNADDQDICVYMKGNVYGADGIRRALAFQWAFTTDGIERKDTYKYEISKSSGKRDSRIIEAICTQTSRSDQYSIDLEATTTLKRIRITDKDTETIALSGAVDADDAMTCQGSLSSVIAQTVSSDTQKKTTNTTVDLLFTPRNGENTVSGTVVYQTLTDKTVERELAWTLAADAAEATAKAESSDNTEDTDTTGGVVVSIISPETETDGEMVDETATPVSSLEQMAAEISTASQTETQEDSSPYLVGSAPTGLTTFSKTESLQTIDLDKANADTVQLLLTEAAQNLAGRLILAIANLPEDDAALLQDGMTDTDYAAFLALLDEL